MANLRIPAAQGRRRAAAAAPLGRSSGWRAALRLCACLADWHGRWRERQALQALDDRLLRDLGLTRQDVQRETEKAFWRR